MKKIIKRETLDKRSHKVPSESRRERRKAMREPSRAQPRPSSWEIGMDEYTTTITSGDSVLLSSDLDISVSSGTTWTYGTSPSSELIYGKPSDTPPDGWKEGTLLKGSDDEIYMIKDGEWAKLSVGTTGDFESEKEENVKNKIETYEMIKIKEVLEKVYNNEDLRRTIVPLFIGDPGLGKTVLIQDFAKEKNVKLVELITSQMSPFEISGIAMPDKDIKKMVYYNFDKLESLQDGDILFFDELLNGNPVVLNACLTILEQRKYISGKDLPNIMIVAAANPQGMAPLTPQIKERFVWYNVKFDRFMWMEYMKKKYYISDSIGRKLASLINNESFLENNFYTPRSIDKAVNMLIKDVVTPYNEVILPILSEMVKNPFDKEVTLPGGKTLLPEEMISWIDLIRLKFGIFTPKKEKKRKPAKVEVVTEASPVDLPL